MDEDSTQPSTYPLDVGERNRNSSNLSLEDELDIICLLRPCSRVAFDIAEKVARNTPQHVLHSGELPHRYRRVVDVAEENEFRSRPSPIDNGAEMTPDMNEVDMTDYSESGVADIALRLSSRVTDMDMGFVFGRDPRKCDIVLPVEDRTAARISGVHFRIFLNDNGMIMLEDTSTNGTLVDNFLLKHKLPSLGNSVRRIIQKGSIVAVFVKADRTTARFIVDIPQRRDENAWKKRLEKYVIAVKKARNQKLLMLKNLGTDKKTSKATTEHHIITGMQMIDDPQPMDNMFITAGTIPWNHGMRWNGGERFNVIAKLGSGAFATVYKLVDLNTGDELAAKEIEKRRFMKNGVLDLKITSELNILKRLKHPHVIESFDHVDTKFDLYILMELVPYGDLSAHIGTSEKLSDHNMRLVSKQMCQALGYLHDNGIAHRDIKPENIIKKKVKPLLWIKLADFGLSKIITQDDHHQTAYQTFCGTLLYCAPEVYPGFAHKRAGLPPDPRTTRPSPYSTAVDIWSLAAVLFHLLCGIPPYEASAANHGVHMLDTIFEERFPRAKFDNADVHRDWELFFENTLQLTAQQRWSARRLLKLPWMVRIEDAVPVNYKYQNPNKDFALEDESSDEEMGDVKDLYHLQPMSAADVSQLSLNNDPLSDDDDAGISFVSDNEATMIGNRQESLPIEGLGIEITPTFQIARAKSPDSGNRYHLRSRSNRTGAQPGSETSSSPVRENLFEQFVAPSALPSSSKQIRGKLFGEITDSGIFGSTTPAPRTVNTGTVPASDEHLDQDKAHVTALLSEKSMSKRRISENEAEKLFPASPKHSKNFSGHRQASIIPDNRDKDKLISRSEIQPFSEYQSGKKASIGHHGISVFPHEEKEIRMFMIQPQHSRPNIMGADDEKRVVPEAASLSIESPVNLNVYSHLSSMKNTVPSSLHGVSFTSSSRPPSPNEFCNQTVGVLGVLTPGRKSVPVDPIYITSHKTQYGRAPECTHRHPDLKDVRVPKSAFTILLHDPEIDNIGNNRDWTKTNFYAVIGTRCSGHILINNIPMTRNKTNEEDNTQMGLIQSGDVIEIFDKPDSHLRFHVKFLFGAAMQERDNKKDPFKVLLGQRAILEEIREKEALTPDRSVIR